ncbi:uncharacterized protein [Hoplias malabaricus]|uniref:uncharacterized protein n=1 Tax=Hoplias malabaricus TaxID=27720 RepID=UPI00346346A7
MDDDFPRNHSNNSGNSAFSAEERAFIDDLLKNSKEFIRLYEEHQHELQQNIHQLEVNSEDFLDDYFKAAPVKRRRRIFAVAVGAGLGVGFVVVILGQIFAAITVGVYISIWVAIKAMAINAVGAGAFTTVFVLTMYLRDQHQQKLSLEAMNTLKKFSVTADRVTSPLNSICDHIKRILVYHKDEALRKSTGDLSGMAELFKPKELLGMWVQAVRALEMAENIKYFMATPPLMTNDTKTIRDINKLKILSTVQENELESETGRFIWNMKETIIYSQDTLNLIRNLKAELENTLIQKLSECFKEQRLVIY